MLLFLYDIIKFNSYDPFTGLVRVTDMCLAFKCFNIKSQVFVVVVGQLPKA